MDSTSLTYRRAFPPEQKDSVLEIHKAVGICEDRHIGQLALSRRLNNDPMPSRSYGACPTSP